MAIQLEYFLIKRQNGECNVCNVRRFLFGMSPDVPAFQVRSVRMKMKVNIPGGGGTS